jgi:hypothetical protein
MTPEEIGSFHTGLAVGDDYFAKNQDVTIYNLLPVVHSLTIQCDSLIKEPGVYAFRLQIVKLK